MSDCKKANCHKRYTGARTPTDILPCQRIGTCKDFESSNNRFQYQSKPVKPTLIEAFQYDGDLKNREGDFYVPQWAIDAFEKGVLYYTEISGYPDLRIVTKLGSISIDVGDYVYMDDKGGYHVQVKKSFESEYSKVRGNS